jgi:hypothetical protein
MEGCRGAAPSTQMVSSVGTANASENATGTSVAASNPPAPEEAPICADEEPVSMSFDVDPTDRSFDRLLACFGLLDDAAPVFGDANAVWGAGVLFAMPVLVSSGIFRLAHKLYGEIGPAFYGLRTTLLTLLLMALWRIKRPEALKEREPAMLGRILGLDRAPEVKTVRRKLTRLASYVSAQRSHVSAASPSGHPASFQHKEAQDGKQEGRRWGGSRDAAQALGAGQRM